MNPRSAARRGSGRCRALSDRRAANEKAFAHCDLLVIGAGPAGLMAALTAGRAGADVILAEEEAPDGGRLLSEDEEVGGLRGVTGPTAWWPSWRRWTTCA